MTTPRDEAKEKALKEHCQLQELIAELVDDLQLEDAKKDTPSINIEYTTDYVDDTEPDLYCVTLIQSTSNSIELYWVMKEEITREWLQSLLGGDYVAVSGAWTRSKWSDKRKTHYKVKQVALALASPPRDANIIYSSLSGFRTLGPVVLLPQRFQSQIW